MCDNDELEIVRPGKICPNSLHDFVPVIDDDKRVSGLICQACGHRVHEDATSGAYSVTDSGKVLTRNVIPRRDL